MPGKQEQRSEETKRKILESAAALFSERGYDAVTMREIARKAGCSHTTIYIYFADKEALLHQLSMPPLLELKQNLSDIFQRTGTPESKFIELCLTWIRFCLTHRNMYTVFFGASATRVDEAEPKLAINKLRIELFGMLTQSLQACLRIGAKDERLLSFSRVTFYTMHGIVGTYMHSAETMDQLMDRLAPTFRDAFEALLIGFARKIREGGDGK